MIVRFAFRKRLIVPTANFCVGRPLKQLRHNPTSHCHEYYIGIHILFRTGLVKLCQNQVILTYRPEFRLCIQ